MLFTMLLCVYGLSEHQGFAPMLSQVGVTPWQIHPMLGPPWWLPLP